MPWLPERCHCFRIATFLCCVVHMRIAILATVSLRFWFSSEAVALCPLQRQQLLIPLLQYLWSFSLSGKSGLSIWLIFMFWTVKRVVGWVLWLGDVSHSIRPAFHVTLYFVVRPAPLVRRLFGYFEGFLWNERIWIFLFLCLIVFDCDYAPLPS